MGRPTLYKTSTTYLKRNHSKTRTGVTWFYADFMAGKKRVTRKLSRDRKEAEAMLKDLRSELIASKTEKVPITKAIRLAKAQELELNQRFEPLKPNTLSKYRSADKMAREHFGKGHYLNRITSLDVKEWLKKRREEVGPATVNRDLKRLRQVCEWAIEQGKLKKNPCEGIKELRVPKVQVRYLKMDEQEALRRAASPELWMMIRFAMLTGLRVSEQLSVEWSQVVDNQIRLRSDQCKWERARSVPFDEPVEAILKQAKSRYKDICSRLKKGKGAQPVPPYVFPSPRGYKWDRDNFGQDFWRPARQEAGVKNFTWHDLRHTFASRLVMAGESLYTVAELLGHDSIKTTKKYAHLSPGHLREAVKVLR